MNRSIAIATLVFTSPAALAQDEIPEPPPEMQPIGDHPFFIAVTVVGAVGGLATSIGAIVYAIQNRSFHSAWVPTTFLASAICAGLSGALMYDAAQDGATLFNVGGAVLFVALAAWPTAWVLRSSLSDADPGARFDSDVTPAHPEASVRQNQPRSIAAPIVALTF